MKVEIWSDFVCPFCYIGKRKFEAALEKFPHKKNIVVEYKSYELSPDAENNPGKDYFELLASKLGMSIEKAKETTANIGRQATDVGLTYHFDTMQTSNTFDAHRVAKYAASQGKGNEMTERILKAHFTDSEHIGDHATLIKLANEVGLETEKIEALLKTDKYEAAVREDQEQARQIGVQGVPFFVFNEKYAVSGAQPPEVFSEVLEKVWKEDEQPDLKSLNSKKSETTYCSDENCDGSK